jgi:2-keto-3-deoxy-L-rhamnonate aldolase RhmA
MRPDLPSSDLTEMAARVSLFVMIETAEGLRNVEEIAQVPGLGGIYVAPRTCPSGSGWTRCGRSRPISWPKL